MPYETTATAGPMALSLKLEKEREVDVDDREAPLTIEASKDPSFAGTPKNVTVDLSWDYSTDHIVLGPKGAEKDKGASTVSLGPSFNGTTKLNTKTGAFISTPPSDNNPSAATGPKTIKATVKWEIDKAGAKTATPQTSSVTMQFVIAAD